MNSSPRLLFALVTMLCALGCGAAELKWNVDPQSGHWSLGGSSLSLQDAVTTAEVDGASITMGECVLSAPVAVRDAIGEGERTVATGTANGLEISLSITLYRTGPRALVEATLRNVGDRPRVVTSFRAFQARMKTESPAQECRLFRNSGAQGTSGVFPAGGKGGQQSAYVSAILDPKAGHSLTLGMVSYHRADTRITTRVAGANELELTADAEFTRIAIKPGDSLSSEAYLLEWSDDPLTALEHYASALAALHQIKVSPDRDGFWNVWYAYKEQENSEAKLLECAEFQGRHLVKWGITRLSTGVWQRDNSFMETRLKPDLYLRGLQPLADDIRSRGVEPGLGGFFARVTETTPLFREHPEFMVRDADGQPFMVNKISWGRCPYPHYLPDMTHPGMQQWYRDYWKSFVAMGYRESFWIDFEGGSSKGTRFDPAINAPFETDRLRLKIIREAIGPKALVGSYTSPTNRYLGFVDRVRMSADVGLFGSAPNWTHLRNVARNMAAAWLYHDRVWMNDPDPPMIGAHADPARLEEVRIRMLIVAMSGGFITLGDRMPEMEPAQFRLLSTLLPPLGVAARPVDLFRREMPEIQDVAVKTAWDSWHVVSVINWDDPAIAKTTAEVQADSEALAGNNVPYAARNAFDGKPGTSLAAPGACWSADSKKAGPHWISLAFRQPRQLSELAIHWTTYKKFDPEVEWWTSAQYEIQAWVGDDWKTIAEIHNEVPVAGLPVSTHRFPPVTTSRVRILQPEAGGPPRRPKMMAIGEIELNPSAAAGRAIRVDFAELGLPRGEEYFAYEFWNQKPLGRVRDGLTVSLPPHTSRLLAIRKAPDHPWIVGTDLHVSQGGVELREVKWDAATSTLSGIAQRPGEKGHLAIYLPKGFAVNVAQIDGRDVTMPSVDGEITRLPVAFDGKPVVWSVSFLPR